MSRKPMKPPLKHQGFGPIHSVKLSASQLKTLRKQGYIYVTIKGVRKRVTKANVRNGRIYWYRRGDTIHKIALRNFARDKKIKATHRAMRGKGYTGD